MCSCKEGRFICVNAGTQAYSVQNCCFSAKYEGGRNYSIGPELGALTLCILFYSRFLKLFLCGYVSGSVINPMSQLRKQQQHRFLLVDMNRDLDFSYEPLHYCHARSFGFFFFQKVQTTVFCLTPYEVLYLYIVHGWKTAKHIPWSLSALLDKSLDVLRSWTEVLQVHCPCFPCRNVRFFARNRWN